jgi:nucleoside-diphosphate kinase
MTERTLLFIKPDAVRRKLTGRIIDRIESSGLTIVGLKMVQLDQPRAEKFYEIHRGKPFFDDLMTFIISGPIVACLIEGDDCVRKIRTIIGATDPAKAAPGTVRKLYGTSITQNCVHASNPDENPAAEINFFFP